MHVDESHHDTDLRRGNRTTRAELPAGVPQGAFGPRLQAMVSLLSGQYHLSKREAAEVMMAP